MIKKVVVLLVLVFTIGCKEEPKCTTDYIDQVYPPDSILKKFAIPDGLVLKNFSGPDVNPSPACMAVSATGEVFVGVDMMGSLGKEIGKGFIKRLVDCDHDGVMDSYTEFAQVDNPRGIIAIGDQVFVLHTTFSEVTKKASNMDLIVFDDKNNDGKADGSPKVLIKNISNPKYLRDRGTDHATNGIQMGIDGWIYIAVGDFGFYNATDTSGKKMTMLGGGILRVRPNGTEMEVYTHGLRNIYDVAIDPFMNIFTRGNTNDGGGWNIRFIHQIQSGEYGYPILFKHFTEETIPALVDVGGGSGTGALFMNDQRWPAEFNNVPMMADWGKSQLFIHRVKKDGPSFTQNQEQFIQLPQVTDVDVDAAGAMYLSAWDGAGYSGNPDKGFVVRVTPKNFAYEKFTDVKDASVSELVNLLKTENAKSRLSAQYQLLQRPKDRAASAVLKLVNDKEQSLEVRAAAIFTYGQIAGVDGIDNLVALTKDAAVQKFALRALADRKGNIDKVPMTPFLEGLASNSVEVRAVSIVGLGRLGRTEAAKALLETPVPSSFVAPKINTEGPHATPNSEIIIPHLAAKALRDINAVDECVAALDTDKKDMAMWAMRTMHEDKVVNALIEAYSNSDADKIVDGLIGENKNAYDSFKHKIMNNLARIYYKEQPYDASWWWSTRPDTHGPYYKTMEWEQSPVIRAFLVDQFKKSGKTDKQFYAELNSKYRLGIDVFGEVKKEAPKEDLPVVDFEKIKNKKGQIGESSIEDVMLVLGKIKGEAKKGKDLFNSQGCVACHSLSKEEVMKGPFMGQVGSIMNREQIAESILKPNASISQGFSTVQIKTKDGKNFVGFVTEESAEKLTIRNIIGAATELSKSDIETRKELETSMMPAGLANSLSFEEMASLVTFLQQQK